MDARGAWHVMNVVAFGFLGGLSLMMGAMAVAENQPLETVSNVDLTRYAGTWFEIAAFPQRFEKDCTGAMAEYTLQPNGKVRVVNSCRLKTLTGKRKIAKGRAHVVDHATNAKLKVTFFWPFYGDYWILDLGDNYEYAMVGSPNRKYLWFLSRTPQLDPSVMDHLRNRARDLGFDIAKLKPMLQAVEQ